MNLTDEERDDLYLRMANHLDSSEINNGEEELYWLKKLYDDVKWRIDDLHKCL